MTREGSAEQTLFLSCMPSTPRDRRIAFAVVLASALIFAAAAPFAKQPLGQIWSFIPIYESALCISDLITAAILFGQFQLLHSRALLFVAAGYLFTALISIPHMLSFPGVFSPAGLMSSGPQTTVWLYMFWHAGFPATIIAYALHKPKPTTHAATPGAVRRALMLALGLVAVAVPAITLLATTGHSLLPPLMRGNNYEPGLIFVVGSIWAMNIVAIALLWLRRPQTVLDLWLMVVMCAWVFDIALSAILNGGRFDLGFYVGRVYGLLAATLVLITLLLESGRLYKQLVGQFAVEKSEHRREAEERRRLFETSPDLILVVDQTGTFLRVSPSSAAILGYQPEELIGRNAVDFVHPDDLESIRAEMRRARHGHQVRDFPTRYIHRNGRIVMLSWSGVWSKPEQRHFFIGRDVTEQKRIERMKDEFIATVNHELRTPVTTIAGPLSLLMAGAGGELPPRARQLADMAQRNCARLARLVGAIVDLDRLQTGGMVFELSRVDVRPLVEEAIEAQQAMARTAGVCVRVEEDGGDFAVRADPNRLMQVLENLLSNAIKFSPRNAEVRVSIGLHGEFCRIAIRDRGPGIPDDFKPYVFETFAQVEAANTRQKGGAGLGLSIVKETMTRLGGEVGWKPAPGGGTTFHVDVPLWVADREDNAIEFEREPPDIQHTRSLAVEQSRGI